jgi:hypothetical protein
MKRPTKKAHRLDKKVRAAAGWVEDSKALNLTCGFAFNEQT